MAASIPDEKDWKAMDRIPASEVIKKHLAVWGQVGILLAGAGANAHVQEKEIEELSGRLSEKEKEISEKNLRNSELEKALASSSSKASGLVDELKKVVDRADAVKTEFGVLEKRVGELEAELSIRKPESEVIAAFKESAEYTTALAGAAAKKILWCWIVAEKHIKIDAESSWEKFADLYVAAEEAYNLDGTEPEPYDGPNPVIPQISTTVENRTEHANLDDAAL